MCSPSVGKAAGSGSAVVARASTVVGSDTSSTAVESRSTAGAELYATCAAGVPFACSGDSDDPAVAGLTPKINIETAAIA